MQETVCYDVFLSHNSQDKSAVEALARRLEDEAKLRPWLDKWNLIPGEPWQEAIEAALDASRTCAIFIGPSGLGPWENEEMRSALDTRVSQIGFRVIPVLLPDASLPERGKLPRFLSRLAWVDFRAGLNDSETFRRLVAGIRGVAPGRNDISSPKLPLIECPYRGLEVFEENHTRFFFGREAMTQHLVEAVRATQFLAVLGPSGSGKSSLIRAGLLPRLKTGALPFSKGWIYLVFRPGAHPLEALALSFTTVQNPDDRLAATRKILSSLETDAKSLHLQARLLVTEQPTRTRVFILIDQFEEIITLCHNENERQQFIANIRYATTFGDGQANIVITMRADFLARAAEYTDLAEMLSRHQFIVSPMDDADLRRAIEEPAYLVGLSFENGLVERVLKDVGHEPGMLPLLEDSLLQLCEKRRGDNMMTLQAYDESGGVHGSLAKRADEVFEKLTPEQQVFGQRILLRLTQPGEGTEDTRRRANVNELWSEPTEQSFVEDVIEILANARLLTTSTDGSGERQVDVAHEALIRGWPRLRRWIDENRMALRTHRRLTEAAQEWKERNRDVSFLYRGAKLASAKEWWETNDATLNQLEREFLDASFQLHLKERLRAKLRTLSILTVLSIAVVFISLSAWRSSRDQKIAFSREIAANAKSQLMIDPELSLRLAIEACKVHPTREAEEILREAVLAHHLRSTLGSHTGMVQDAQFNSDGSMIVTGSTDGEARIWNAKTGEPIRELDTRTAVESARFSPKGDLVVTAQADDVTRIWDVSTGNLLKELSLPLQRTRASNENYAEFSPDGKLVATSSIDGGVAIFEVDTGRMIQRLNNQTLISWSPAFSFDSKLIMTSNQKKSARVWEVKTGKILIEIGDLIGVYGIEFTSDRKSLIAAGEDSTVRIWDITVTDEVKGRILNTLQTGTIPLSNVTLSPDGKIAVDVSKGLARVWSVDSGKKITEFNEPSDILPDFVFSPDGESIAAAGRDNIVRVWDVKTGAMIMELRGHTGVISNVNFSPDSKSVVTASWDKTARVWDTSSMQSRIELVGQVNQIKKAAVDANGEKLVTIGNDNEVRVWGAKTGETQLMLPSRNNDISALVLSNDGNLLLIGNSDGTVEVLDTVKNHGRVELNGKGGAFRQASISPDQKSVVVVSKDQPYISYTVSIWDINSGAKIKELGNFRYPLSGAIFSPDGRLVLVATWDNSAYILDIGTAKILQKLSGHSDAVLDAEFSPDGKLIVTTSRDRTACIWDVSRGVLLSKLEGHKAAVDRAIFSPDGRLVVSFSRDETAKIWDTKSGRMCLELRGHKGEVLDALFISNSQSVVTVGSDGTVRTHSCETCMATDKLLEFAKNKMPRELTVEERKKYLHN